MKAIRGLLDIFCILVAVVILSIAGMYYKGIKPYIMVTGSMRSIIPEGSVCFVDTEYSYSEIEVNDIIMYQSKNQKVIHRVIGEKENAFITKGDDNKKADLIDITSDLYLGKYMFSVPKAGYLTSKLQDSVGRGIFVTGLIALYVIDYLMHYAKKRKE